MKMTIISNVRRIADKFLKIRAPQRCECRPISSEPETTKQSSVENQQQLILRILNESPRESLLRYKCFNTTYNRLRLNSIIDHIHKNGPLTDTDQIKHIKFLTKRDSDQMCNSIMKSQHAVPDPQLPSYILDETVLHPRYAANEIPEQVMGIHLDYKGLSWAVLDQNLLLQDWGTRPLFDKPNFRHDHAALQEKLWEVVHALPDADVCVMEEEQTSLSKSPVRRILTPAHVNSARIESVFTSLINHRAPNTYPLTHRVFKVKPNIVSEYFGILVARQRVRADQVVQDIFSHQCMEAEGVQVPEWLTWVYTKNTDVLNKEHLSFCLIQAVFFYKLLHMCSVKQQKDGAGEE